MPRLLLAALVAGLALASAGASAETYRVSGTQILDPAGRPFVAKGVNINGHNTMWPSDALGDLPLVRDVWKFNTVRVYNRLKPREPNHHPERRYLYDVIDAHLAAGFVVMPELHDQTGAFYRADTEPSLADLVDFWVELATRYGHDSRVWFNIMNEPNSAGAATSPEWDAMHRTVIEAIRGTGARNIIVLDGDSWAQESGVWDGEPVVAAHSAFLTFGPALLTWHRERWGHDNLVFSPHFYREWVYGDAKMIDFLDRCETAGLALLIGEYGAYTNADTMEATYTMGRVAFPRGIGRIVWHWWGGDRNDLTTSGNGGGQHVDRTDGSKPTNLTALGEFVWADNHAPPSDQSPASRAPVAPPHP